MGSTASLIGDVALAASFLQLALVADMAEVCEGISLAGRVERVWFPIGGYLCGGGGAAVMYVPGPNSCDMHTASWCALPSARLVYLGRMRL